MRVLCVVLGVLGLGASAAGQSLAPPARSLQHVTVATSSDATTVKPGQTVTLWVDVTPKPQIHVYARGATGFTPVALVMTPHPDVRVGTPRFPSSEPFLTIGVDKPVPVYRKPFRIQQPVTIAPERPSATGTIIVSAALNYQACDDRVCYPVLSLPAVWRLTID